MHPFYSPLPHIVSRDRTPVPDISEVVFSEHALERLDQRTMMSTSDVRSVLLHGARAVCLEFNSTEERTYLLFFAPGTSSAYVAVTTLKARTATIITLLTQSLWENTRGRIHAEDLRAAAFSSMSRHEFDAWALAYDWTVQRFYRAHLRILCTFTANDGSLISLDVPVEYPVESETLSGGRLGELATNAGFITRTYIDLSQAAGASHTEALSALTDLRVVYGPGITLLDLLAHNPAQIRRRFKNRQLRRSQVTAFVTFFHDQKIVHRQQTRPSIPDELLFEHLLHELRTCKPFLLSVRNIMRTVVPEQDLLKAVQSIQELQVMASGGETIDLVTENDSSAVDLLLTLTSPLACQQTA